MSKCIKKYFLRCFLSFLILLSTITIFASAQKENLNVLDRWIEWSDGGNMLVHHLNKQAFTYLDIRDMEISKLKTKADWIERQKKVKDILMEIVGPFPEKTPLNPRITDTVRKDGFRIEKIIYESMPDYYVTGCLFIPDGIVGKRPAILHVIGHSMSSFRRPDRYQTIILNLVKKGFIVFATDPMGQGERLQYYDAEKKVSMFKGSTREHSYVGKQCFISGVSPGRYFIWDAIRGIDYLLTRSEVDPERIGVTGLSGGGMMTAYLSIFDERIKALAPVCYITGLRRLLESIGPQDAEQNFYHAVSSGITHADFLEIRAPKPILMVTTTRDFFSIQGARETYREVKKAYKAFGKEENFGMVEDDLGHGYTRKNREAIYAFFQRHLNLPGDPTDQKVELFKEEELNITPTGQLSTYIGGKTLFDLNKEETKELIVELKGSRNDIQGHLNNVKQKAKELSGYADPYEECETVFRGRYQRDGYSVEMYAVQGEGDYVIPLLLMIPKGGEKFPAVIYIHPEGKAAEASPGGQIEQLVKKGYIVAAPDLIGTGETRGRRGSGGYLAMLIGRSIAGIQAGDVTRVVNFLKTRSDIEKDKIGAIAIGEMGPILLHAAAFDQSISSSTVLGSPISYKSIVMNKHYEIDFSCTVAGALTAYDLPDLAGCIAPRKLVMAELKDQMNEAASEGMINEELKFPRSVYSLKRVPENLKVLSSYESLNSIIDWCFE